MGITSISSHSQVTVLGGSTGQAIANIGGKLRVSNKPYSHDIAAFAIADHFPVYLLGYVANVNATRVDVWEAAVTAPYVFPAAPIQMSVVSSSASDAAAGTGVRTVDIDYLDTNYAIQSEAVTLNGTTPVNTVATNILRVNNFHAMSAGSTGAAVGNISLTSVGGATTYSRITALGNYARQCIYTVPAGKTLFISGFSAGTTTAAAGHTQIIMLRTTSSPLFELTPGVFMYKTMTMLDNASTSQSFQVPIAVPATADVKVTCVSDGANAAAVSFSVEGWIE